jgi:hypothetical protein
MSKDLHKMRHFAEQPESKFYDDCANPVQSTRTESINSSDRPELVGSFFRILSRCCARRGTCSIFVPPRRSARSIAQCEASPSAKRSEPGARIRAWKRPEYCWSLRKHTLVLSRPREYEYLGLGPREANPPLRRCYASLLTVSRNHAS